MKFKLLRVLVNIIAVIYFVFDEAFVYLSTKFEVLILKIKGLEKLILIFNDIIDRTNKNLVLLYFVVLLVVSELFGIYSFILLSKGIISGFIILYGIKFIPFFIMKHIFNIKKHDLLTIKWFNYSYNKVNSVTDYLKNTEIVVYCKSLVDNLKIKLKEILK